MSIWENLFIEWSDLEVSEGRAAVSLEKTTHFPDEEDVEHE